MQNLLMFFVRHNAFFVFIFLELICFYLIVNFNKKQKDIYINSANSFTASIEERYSKVVGFWQLDDVNEELAKDNKRLMEQLPMSFFDNSTDTISVTDTSHQQQYEYIPSKVVSNTVNRHNNYLTLDKGSKHGIESNTGVISSAGLVGIILKTSKNYAAVMSLLHKDTKISGMIKNSHYFGSLVWEGLDPHLMTLQAVPKHAMVQKGDTIVTSGYSHMFPEGVLIGVVDNAELEPGSNFYTIDVRLSSDLNKIKHVYVVKDLMKSEKLQLEESVKNE